jgi:hypothetical protein
MSEKKAKKAKELTSSEIKFVEHYLEHDDVALAAKHAGLTIRTGYRLKNHPKTKEMLEEASEKAALRMELSREKIFRSVMETKRLASLGDYPNYAVMLKADETLAKMLGYFEPDKSEQKDLNISIAVLNHDGGASEPG